MNSSTTSRTGRRAFTLIELLVVIAIVSLLTGMLFVVVSVVRRSSRLTQAKKEVNEIGDALKTYFMAYHGYPPDSDDWGTKGGYDETSQVFPSGRDVDLTTIHRYLAMDRTIKRRLHTSQMTVKEDRLEDFQVDGDEPGAQEAGVYVDPWGTPFQIDCTHMWFDDGRWRQKGWPYRRTGGAEPSELEKKRFKVNYKVVSYGPDEQSGAFPFGEPQDGERLKMSDDVRSW
jgi:prepilin-type N-terminal cleavage/methylation domain-containing protein